MSTYRQIRNTKGEVRTDLYIRDDGINCLVGSNDPAAQACQAWLDDGNTPLPPSRDLAFPDFIALFTADEQTALLGSADPKVRLFLLNAAAVVINLADAATRAELDHIVAAGLITQDRETAILAAASA